jgi:tetratricopeptide (TPR) repeat protein
VAISLGFILNMLLMLVTAGNANPYAEQAEMRAKSGKVADLVAAAALWEAQGEYSQAITALSRCAELDKPNAVFYLSRGGNLAALMGDHVLAASLYRSAATIPGDAANDLRLRADMETVRARLDLAIPEGGDPAKPDVGQLWEVYAGKVAVISKTLRSALSHGSAQQKAMALLYIAQAYERLGSALVGWSTQPEELNPITTKLSPAVGEFYAGVTIKDILEMAATNYSLAAFLIQNGDSPDWRWAGPAQDRFFTLSEMIGNLILK